MEKIDILFIALIIAVLIVAVYISYLKAKTNFLLYVLNQHTDALNGLVNIADSQRTLFDKQTKANDTFIEFSINQIKLNNKFEKHLQDKTVHSPSFTGGRRSEAEA